MKTRLLVCIVALFALTAASCGGSDEADLATTDPVAEQAEATDASSGEEAMDDEAMDDEAMDDEAMDDEAMDEEAMDDDSATTDSEAEGEAMAEAAALAEAPQRIVSMSPSATEMLFAMGAGDQVIAVDQYSYFPAEAPVTDLDAFTPNVEAIAGYEPDLVISSFPIEGLDAIGIENLVAPAATNLDEIYAQIELLGAMTGNLGGAAELVLQMQTDIEAAIASAPEREVPLTYYHELDNTLYSVTSSTFIGYVYDQFGMTNIADPADPDGESFGYPQLNEEFIITADPDIIFLADTLCCEQNAETVAARAGWDQLQAVQNGHVIELNDDVVSRWGPRIVDFFVAVGDAVNEIETVPAS